MRAWNVYPCSLEISDYVISWLLYVKLPYVAKQPNIPHIVGSYYSLQYISFYLLFKITATMEILRPSLINISGRVYRRNTIKEDQYEEGEEDNSYMGPPGS